MDPLTASTTLATIVGLICNYKQERGNRKDLDQRDFIEWLNYHRHEDIKNLIVNTHGLQEEVNCLLREDHAQILKKLDSINDILSQVLSRVSGFGVLTQHFGSSTVLSDQALHILCQFAASKSNEVSCIQDISGDLHFMGITAHVDIKIKDQLFVRDDLHALESLGFIRVTQYASSHEVSYCLTRAGARYAELVK
jgi:hypothetical protein